MKVLVIASEPISADRLRAALGETTDDAEILVVAPALHRSALRFGSPTRTRRSNGRSWSSERPSRTSTMPGSTLTGSLVKSDPVQAVEDALVTFPAEQIVLFSRPDSARRHDESIDADALQQRFGVSVQRAD